MLRERMDRLAALDALLAAAWHPGWAGEGARLAAENPGLPAEMARIAAETPLRQGERMVLDRAAGTFDVVAQSTMTITVHLRHPGTCAFDSPCHWQGVPEAFFSSLSAAVFELK